MQNKKKQNRPHMKDFPENLRLKVSYKEVLEPNSFRFSLPVMSGEYCIFVACSSNVLFLTTLTEPQLFNELLIITSST